MKGLEHAERLSASVPWVRAAAGAPHHVHPTVAAPHLQQPSPPRTSLVQSQLPAARSCLHPELPPASTSLPSNICIPKREPFHRLSAGYISKLGPTATTEAAAAAGHPALVRICPNLSDSSSLALWLLPSLVRQQAQGESGRRSCASAESKRLMADLVSGFPRTRLGSLLHEITKAAGLNNRVNSH